VAEGEECRRHDVADAARLGGIRRLIRRIISEPGHQRVETRLLTGKEIDQDAIGGEADGLRLVGSRRLVCGPAQSTAESRAKRVPIVGRPGVIDRRMQDRQGARSDGWPGASGPNRLQTRIVPGYDYRIL
jgi:hypothetical protein